MKKKRKAVFNKLQVLLNSVSGLFLNFTDFKAVNITLVTRNFNKRCDEKGEAQCCNGQPALI